MDEAFSQSLADWSAYFTLMGGAAATLLGLLFVAVSLRLNIFRQREVADVRNFAAFTLGTIVVALIIAGLALVPHGRRAVLVAVLLLIGVAGFLAVASIARLWLALESPKEKALPGYASRGLVYLLIMVGPYSGALVAALLLWRVHPDALGWLAVVEAWLLVCGTAATWLMLSHAGRRTDEEP